MRRAIAYLRVTETHPPEPQRRAIEVWAERQCVEVSSWQIDVGVGGATPIAERRALLAAYAALREEQAQILVAAEPSRFTTDRLVAWLIERAALSEGATLHTAERAASSRWEGPPPQKAVSFTRSAIDLARAYQRVSAGERIRASLAEKRARGERVGNVPYGYRLAADRVHIELDEAEQAVVATVRRLARHGLAQRAIVARLAESGVTGRTGAPLGQTQVAAILRSA